MGTIVKLLSALGWVCLFIWLGMGGAHAQQLGVDPTWGPLEVSGGGGGTPDPATNLELNVGVKLITDADATANDGWYTSVDGTMCIAPQGADALCVDGTVATFSGGVAMAAGEKLYFRGVAGNDYITSGFNDQINFYINSALSGTVNSSGVYVASGSLYGNASGSIGLLSRWWLDGAADGQFTICNGGSTSCATLDVDDLADTVVVKSSAGTGIGHLAVDPNGSICTDGAGGGDCLKRVGAENTLLSSTGGITLDPNNGLVTIDGSLTVAPFTRHVDRIIGAESVGATAPSVVDVGTARCLQFAQVTTGETAHTKLEIPSDWVGNTDWAIELHVYGDPGDAPLDTETITWTVTYRAIAEGEAYDNGTATSVSAAYTQSGAGVDKGRIDITATIDYDDANQPLTAGDDLLVQIDLNEGSTSYSGDPILCSLHLSYQSNTFAED